MESTASSADKVAPTGGDVASSEGARDEVFNVEAGISFAGSSSASLGKAVTARGIQGEDVVSYSYVAGIEIEGSQFDIEIGGPQFDYSKCASAITHGIQDEEAASYITGKEIGGSRFCPESVGSAITGFSRQQRLKEVLEENGFSREQLKILEILDVVEQADQEEKTEEGSKDENDDRKLPASDASVAGVSEGSDEEEPVDASGKEQLRKQEEKIARDNTVSREVPDGPRSEDQIRPSDTSTEKELNSQVVRVGERLSRHEFESQPERVAERLSRQEFETQPGAYPVAAVNEGLVEEEGSNPVPFPPGDPPPSDLLPAPVRSPSINDLEANTDNVEELGGTEGLIEATVVEEPIFAQVANTMQPLEIDVLLSEHSNERGRLSENSQRSMQELQEQVARERRSKIRTRILCGLSLFLVLPLIILSALGMFSPPDPKPLEVSLVDDCPHGPSELFWNGTFLEQQQLLLFLQDAILNDPCSSQSLANDWMLSDPLLHSYSRERQFQRYLMASAWYSTNGSNWKNNDGWMSYYVSECEWYTSHPDKKVCDENNVLRIVNLTNNGLQGIIPTEALQLAKMTTLDVSHNELSGIIPYMGKEVVTTLEYVDYSHNKLRGQFLVEFVMEGMAIKHFNVRGNQFTGTLPMFYMPKMTHLDMRDNLFVGKIPSALGEMGRQETAKLEVALLGGNFLTGTVPPQVGLLKNLRIVDLSGNAALHGTLPQELGSLQKLEWVNLTATQVAGSIPRILCEKVNAGELIVASDCGSNPELQCCPAL